MPFDDDHFREMLENVLIRTFSLTSHITEHLNDIIPAILSKA